jgi:hypothetical protein
LKGFWRTCAETGTQPAFGEEALKNQWFGDKRDHFKFDLWLEVAENVKGIRKLTYIPMLTPSVAPYEKGKRRERLYAFLEYWHLPQCRSITRMRDFLGTAPFEYHPYRDDDEAGFQDGSWDAYFRDVQEEWLRDAAILIDPDTGLRPKAPKEPEKYITFDNVADIVRRSSGNSVVLVFQYLQRNAERREKDLTEKSRDLHRRVGSEELGRKHFRWIAERTKKGLGDLAFFVAAVTSQMADPLDRVLTAYARTHDLECELVRGVQGIPAR